MISSEGEIHRARFGGDRSGAVLACAAVDERWQGVRRSQDGNGRGDRCRGVSRQLLQLSACQGLGLIDRLGPQRGCGADRSVQVAEGRKQVEALGQGLGALR